MGWGGNTHSPLIACGITISRDETHNLFTSLRLRVSRARRREIDADARSVDFGPYRPHALSARMRPFPAHVAR